MLKPCLILLRSIGLRSSSSLPPAEAASKVAAGEGNALHGAATGASIAVVPFVNLSADPSNEYFCDGLAEELINALSKLEHVRVAARTSAFSFKGKQSCARLGRI